MTDTRTVTELRNAAIATAVHLVHGPELPADVAAAAALCTLATQELAAVLDVLAADVNHSRTCPFDKATGGQVCTCGLIGRLGNVPRHLFPPTVWERLTVPAPAVVRRPSSGGDAPWLRRSN